MNLFGLLKETIRKRLGFPRQVLLQIASGKKAGFVLRIIDVIAVEIPYHFGELIPIESVDDLLFGRCQCIETRKDDLAPSSLFQQRGIVKFRQIPCNHAIIAFPLTHQTLAQQTVVVLQALIKVQILLLFLGHLLT